jgi:uncharacterized protein (TIGR03118 family)
MRFSIVGTFALTAISAIGCTDPATALLASDEPTGDGPAGAGPASVGPAGAGPTSVGPLGDAGEPDVDPPAGDPQDRPRCSNGFARVDLSTDPALMGARALVEMDGALRIVATTGLTGSYDDAGELVAGTTYDLGAGLTSVVSVEGHAFPMRGAVDCGTAKLIFSTEGGRLIAVNPELGSRDGVVVVDRSDVGADYKGVAVLETDKGPLLLAADFFNDRLDVFDTTYQLVDLGPNAFVGFGFPDPTLGMTNVAVLDGDVYITYATKDATGHQPADIPGGGLVARFTPGGEVVGQMGCTCLSRPFGLAIAPPGYVARGKRLLVANKGYGGIVGLDPELQDGSFLDFVLRPDRQALEIEGLTGISFDARNDRRTLFFTATPDDAGPSSFGRIEATCQ